jgi:uncharacterized protein YjhX (UPF0386 family)
MTSHCAKVIHPTNLRVLHQFGLLEKLKDIGSEFERVRSFTKDGYMFKDSDQIKVMKQWFVDFPFTTRGRLCHR